MRSFHHELVRAVAAAIAHVDRTNCTYNNMARAAIKVVQAHYKVKSARILKVALDRERRKTAKLEARIAAAFPAERRYDRFGEMRTLARAPEGYRIIRRTGCGVWSFVMTDTEWNKMASEPIR